MLPKKIYVYEEKDGEETYLICNKTILDASDQSEKRLIGEYELKKTMRTEMVVKIT